VTKLYELTGHYRQILELAEEMDAELFTDTLQSITDAIEDKAENMAYVIKSIEADVKALKEEESRLKDRRTALENRVASMKQYLFDQLSAACIEKVKRPKITVSIVNNPASVEVADELVIPEDYLVPQPPKVDRKAILERLKAGEEVPGCSLKQGKGLRIR
jgi:predicted extracellular nuclease